MLAKICASETEIKNTKFYCKKCDYSCNKQFLLNQHNKTKKHLVQECSQMLDVNMLPQQIQQLMCKCGKTYKHQQSYNRHIKTCNKEINLKQEKKKGNLNQENKEKNITIDFKSIKKQDIDENYEIDEMNEQNETDEEIIIHKLLSNIFEQNNNIISEHKEMKEMVTKMMPNMGNSYTINNKFNIQVFLNEECKDALNLTDFVKTLQMGLRDLYTTKETGYTKGITNIFVRELKQLEIHKRPIHCSDLKRETIYIKNNDEWAKETNDRKSLKQAIACVTKRQINAIDEWEDANPNWKESEDCSMEYIDIVRNVTNTGEDEVKEKIENKIIKSIAKEVLIDK